VERESSLLTTYPLYHRDDNGSLTSTFLTSVDVNALEEAMRSRDFVARFVAAKAAQGHVVEAEISGSGDKVAPGSTDT